MTVLELLTVLAATAAAWLAPTGRPSPAAVTARSRRGVVSGRVGREGSEPPSEATEEAGWLHRGRWLWCAIAALSVWAWVGGEAGLVAGVLAGGATGLVITRSEPASSRRARAAARAELPHVVALLAAALRGGAAPEVALGVVCDALPGAAAERLRPVRARLAVGVAPSLAWSELAGDPVLGQLGRALARSQRTGAAVAEVVASVGTELARARRAQAEDRARTVGVRAAIPLGLCLLPAFVLLGIVPLVAGLAASLLPA